MSRVAVVTGATGGMGSEVSRRLRESGWQVAGFDRRARADVDLSLSVDITDESSVAHAVQAVEQELGTIDVYINAAGHYESIPFTEVTDEELMLMLRVHVGGFVNGSRAVLPGMIERGRGNVISILSELSIGGGARDSHYAAAKGAVLGVVRSAALEVARHGVRVNAVAPGPTNTAMLDPDSPWRDPDYLATLPTRALAEPEDVALCVEYVLNANFMTGEVIHPNSGAVI